MINKKYTDKQRNELSELRKRVDDIRALLISLPMVCNNTNTLVSELEKSTELVKKIIGGCKNESI